MFQAKSGSRPKDAWFRSADWDERAQAAFETRLARAKPLYRVQYRRIKAIALVGSGNAVKIAAGREMLLSIARGGDVPQFERVSAHSLLGSNLHDMGELDEAEAHLRRVLEMTGKNRSGSDGLEAIRLAEILLARGGADDLAEAQVLLDREAGDPSIFVASRFRMALAATRVALARGQHEQAIDWARAALTLADAQHSGLANHPDLLLAKVDKGTRAWLESVAAGERPSDLPRR